MSDTTKAVAFGDRYDTEFDTTVILETEFYENNDIFISHPDQHKCNWKIVSTINVTYAPIQINRGRNKQVEAKLDYSRLETKYLALARTGYW